MLQTRMTELLGISYPIMQGGMQHFGVPELAAAVSNAGALGTINASCFPEFDDFRAAVQRMKALTKNPFAVNISIFPYLTPKESIERYITICGEEGVPIIETSGSSPADYVPMIHGFGIKLIHKVPAAKHCVTAERIGADLVTIAGLEVGGHPGKDEIGTFVLANKAAKLVKIPVLVAGGVADGESLAAALALGGEGVVMGTRFVATQECTIHPNFKQWMLQAQEKDTRLCQKSIQSMIRVADNATSRKCLEMESQGATLDELMNVISGARSREAFDRGEIDGAMFAIGNAVGLVNDLPTCAELVRRTAQQAEAVIARLGSLVK